MVDLRKLVTDKIGELGIAGAKRYFGVSAGTVSNWARGRTDPSLYAIQRVLIESDLAGDISTLSGKERPLIEWEGKNVVMLMPLYRGFASDTHFSLFANYAKYGPEKIGMIMEKRTVIHESRNILTHKFLNRTDAEWCIMTDDDVVPPCGSSDLFASRYGTPRSPELFGWNAISRLMSHPSDKLIVGSLYFGRHANGKAQCSSAFANPTENARLHSGEYKGLKPEEWVAPGFMRIHRSVFSRLTKAIDEGMFEECKPKRDDMWYGFWSPSGVGVGEDVSFGRRCAELGIQSYVDASLVSLHIGECFYGPHNTKY